MEQSAFDFDAPVRKVMPEHPICVLSWRDGRVLSEWPEFLTFDVWFKSWPDALAAVCHPINAHVRLRVRVT